MLLVGVCVVINNLGEIKLVNWFLYNKYRFIVLFYGWLFCYSKFSLV